MLYIVLIYNINILYMQTKSLILTYQMYESILLLIYYIIIYIYINIYIYIYICIYYIHYDNNTLIYN